MSLIRGYFSLDEEYRSGRPTEIYLSELEHLIEAESTLTTREVDVPALNVPTMLYNLSFLFASIGFKVR